MAEEILAVVFINKLQISVHTAYLADHVHHSCRILMHRKIFSLLLRAFRLVQCTNFEWGKVVKFVKPPLLIDYACRRHGSTQRIAIMFVRRLGTTSEDSSLLCANHIKLNA